MTTPPADLSGYAARLLVGTTLTPDSAALTAAGRLPADGPVAAALRDGWLTAEQPTPAPVAAPDGDSIDGTAE